MPTVERSRNPGVERSHTKIGQLGALKVNSHQLPHHRKVANRLHRPSKPGTQDVEIDDGPGHSERQNQQVVLGGVVKMKAPDRCCADRPPIRAFCKTERLLEKPIKYHLGGKSGHSQIVVTSTTIKQTI